ncbi:MAG: BON domain-containing protein [Firmicutes bacterium]|jgi:Flp pilus assembly secretin CpaC|nr:BON domain-containing protein [Bacillota bacterium]NLL87992.1 BON domain-containing protein [Bacillota bacterium]
MNKPGYYTVVIVLTTAFLTTVIGMPAFGAETGNTHGQLVLVQGQSRVLDLDDIIRVAVGDPNIVDVAAIDSKQLLLNPLSLGITSLHVWQKTKQHDYQLRVVADDGTLLSEFLTVLNLPQVSAWFAHGHLVLEGQVSSESEKERAEKLAGAYSDTVISLLHYPMESSTQQLERELRRLIAPEIRLTILKNTVILEGEVQDDAGRLFACRLVEALGYQVIDLVQASSASGVQAGELEQPVANSAAEPSRPVDYASLIREAVGDGLEVYIIGETVFLEGFVANQHRKERAVAIAKAFGMPVVDLVQIAESPADTGVEPALEPLAAGPDAPELILEELNRLIANPAVSVQIVYDYLVLDGRVESRWDKERALRLAAVAGLPVIDLITLDDSDQEQSPDPGKVSRPAVPTPAEPAREQLEVFLDGTGIVFHWIGNTLILEGTVSDEFAKAKALAVGQVFADHVIDLVHIEKPLIIEPGDPDGFEESLIRDVAAALQEPGISVHFYQETLVLEGIVPTAKAKERAERLAAVFYQPVISFVDYPQPGQINAADQLAAHLGLADVQVTAVGTSLILEGTVQNAREHSRILQIAQLYGDVVDLLVIEQPEQVLLQVHIVELDRKAGEELGITWGSLIDGLDLIADVIQFEEVAHIGSWQMNRSFKLGARLTALEKDGKAKLLAAPSLVTLSGKEASFLAGGEIPLVLDLGDRQAVEWVEYGVKLNILPFIENDQIQIHIQPEVSSIDWNTSDRFQSRNPALNTRRTDTTVNLNNGATVIIGGLIQHHESTQIKKIPILGDLPILGALFRSKEYQENETELVIFVTPWIIEEGVGGHGQQQN